MEITLKQQHDRPKDENDYLNNIQRIFEIHDWKVLREVVPDVAKNWINKWSVDMIVCHKKLGTCIGIEGKQFNIRNGGRISKTIKQIHKYKNLSFNGHKIDLWCFAGMDYNTNSNHDNEEIIVQTMNEFGIGVLTKRNGYQERPDRYKIIYGSSVTWGRITLDSTGDDKMDIQKIKNKVIQKQKEMNYVYPFKIY